MIGLWRVVIPHPCRFGHFKHTGPSIGFIGAIFNLAQRFDDSWREPWPIRHLDWMALLAILDHPDQSANLIGADPELAAFLEVFPR